MTIQVKRQTRADKFAFDTEPEGLKNGCAYYPLSLVVSGSLATVMYTDTTREARTDNGTPWRIVTDESVFNSDAETHNNLGVAYLVHGQIDSAIKEYEHALTISPRLARAHNNLGGAYYALGLVMSAIDEWAKAISLEPSLAQAHCNLGVVHKAQGRLDLAIASLETALSLDPSIADADFGLGEIYQAQGKDAQAIDHYRKFILQAPSEDRYYIRMAKEQIRLLRRNDGGIS